MMRYALIILLRVSCIIQVQSFDANTLDSEDIVLKEVDLRVEFKLNNKTYILDGFRSIKNEKIIQTNKTAVFSHLAWYSVGSPILTKPPEIDTLSLANKFLLTYDGFHIFIQMLNDEQKFILQQEALSKYGVNVKKSQIRFLIPSLVSCKMEFNCELSHEKIVLKGSANDLRVLPMKITFQSPYKSIGRQCFEMKLADGHHLDIVCQVQKNSKSANVNMFTVSLSQLNELKLDERVFGQVDWVYMTWQQMAELASIFYSKVFSFDENEIDKEALKNEIQIDLIKLTADRGFEQTPIEEGFVSLSKFNARDLRPDVFRYELSKLLKVKTDGEKNHIVVAHNIVENFTSFVDDAGGGSRAYGYLSLKVVRELQNEWARSSGKSLDDQLAELNRLTVDEIQWSFEGEKIVPKSVSLCKLIKSKFKKDLFFEKIKEKVGDVLFKQQFTLEYQEVKKYNHLRGEIEKGSLEALKVVKRDFLQTCVEECEREKMCHFAQLNNQSECELYDQRGYFYLKSDATSTTTTTSNNMDVRLYERLLYARHNINGFKLRNHLRQLANVSSSHACWLECLNVAECEAVTYQWSNSTCFLADGDLFGFEVSNNFLTITFFKNADKVKNPLGKRYENTKLVDYSTSTKASSEKSCWAECVIDRDCVAVSYKNHECLVNKLGSYLYRESLDGWLTITFQNQSLDSVVKRYNHTKLVDYFKSIKKGSELMCWRECTADVDCVAISYKSGDCLVHKNGSFLYRKEHVDWMTISYENQTLDSVTKRFENTKLVNHFKSIRGSIGSEQLCWAECTNTIECIAVSFKSSSRDECLLYGNNGSSHLHRQRVDGWTTISYDNQRFDSIYYAKTQIHALHMVMSLGSEASCWDECRNRSEWCVAMSYGEGRCHLVKKGEYQRGRYNHWSTVYFESSSPAEFPSNASFSLYKTLTGHSASIRSLAILHNGDLASGSEDNRIKIWNSQDYALKATLDAHSYYVNALIVLHNGNLVSGSGDNTIKIWNNNQIEKTLNSHSDWVYALALLPNTDFVSASADHSIKIWSMNGDLKRTIQNAHEDRVRCLFVLPNGDFASGGGRDHKIKVWDVKNGNLKQTLVGHANWVFALNSLDSGMFLSGSQDQTLRVWDVDGKLLYTFHSNNWILSIAKLPNGDLIVPGSDYNIEVRDQDQVSSGSQLKKATLHTGHVNSIRSLIVFSNGDFVSASDDTTIKIWQTQSSGDN